ncbi:MaoC family dehydratase [Kutzneria sp. CA-103260]|uniref:MaoC family dehydratase n=1 Tax=Kutzneria sp. CA-103260 TaxID=2802641 RepID=UPI001BA4C110|nr:MaoC/PaaZ C-terminal domain-containing protein [Kutzneria sp. CA-103260]QUQ70143.1 MaoC-like dehydratase [Kutzneria sp. CA-103260]
MYLRAALTSFRRGGSSLPDHELSRSEVAVCVEHLAAYNRVCGFGLRDELPATYPHVLAFPLQMRLMTSPGFPFPLPGLVHIGNRITVSRPVLASEHFDLRVRAVDLRPHERGHQFDVVSELLVDSAVVWTDVSTYLRRSGTGSSGSSAGDAPEPSAVWSVPGDIGRRYASVSGDRNPIHLNALAARLFGFRRAIAHGMWTKARSLAALSERLPSSYTVDVRFKLPVLLPAKVGFSASPVAGGWEFAVHDVRTGKPHLSGTLAPTQSQGGDPEASLPAETPS